MINLIRSELLKVRTTNIWWIFAIMLVFFTGLSFTYNALITHAILTDPGMARGSGLDASVAGRAADLYTSGQYFALVFLLVLGALVVTNEYFHQTATTTFLVTPKRTLVIGAKLVAAVAVGLVFWVLTTGLSAIAGTIFLAAEGYGPQFDSGDVWRAMLLNLLGYVIWTIVGVGIGSLIRNQIATVIIAIVGYFVTGTIAQTVAQILAFVLHWTWAPKVLVALPGMASSVMINGAAGLPGHPSRWEAGLILVAWGLAAGIIGTLITRRRDVS